MALISLYNHYVYDAYIILFLILNGLFQGIYNIDVCKTLDISYTLMRLSHYRRLSRS